MILVWDLEIAEQHKREHKNVSDIDPEFKTNKVSVLKGI